uniref:NADH-ubiquinone oxidoreductase chain 5 n=1 Tax=Candida blackwelliae TaxID=497110 RepID=S5U5A3_9ASCO|nr:NADH dehydrogenase subunit 5 [Candida blackwelliae]AGS44553.1 NADH dehydrogenase subunit 5 [Candida blackwelliae]
MNILSYISEINISAIIYPWLNYGDISINYGIKLDSLSMIVLVPVGIITLCVLLYAIEYMHGDPRRNLFLSILSIFAIFMTILVIADNYLVMFIGWEYVGVVSYLLISFWSTRIAAMKAALSAILLNRMGDTFFMIALGILISNLHSVDYNTINILSEYITPSIITYISICLIIAATAKSAQLGLHTWLLSAMEGPTPVSSLLHAATMVCAGVYVLARSSNILNASTFSENIIIYLGALTTLVSGLIATTTNDIKKVIALSTMSQLSMMMISIGGGNYDLAMYHLYCHAFFKALLFMSAGAVIHSIRSETQDIRAYGGLINYMPLTYTMMLIASLSLMAIPGLTGYYSKDIIIESTYGQYNLNSFNVWLLALSSAVLTAIYSIRILYITYLAVPKTTKVNYSFIHENYRMLAPMFILTIYSIYIGYNTNILYDVPSAMPANEAIIDTEFTLPWYIKLAPLVIGLSLSLWLVYIYEYAYKVKVSKVKLYLSSRIHFDQILNNIIIRNVLVLGGNLSTIIDNGLLRILGSTGVVYSLIYIPFIWLIINIILIIHEEEIPHRRCG